MNVDNNIKNDFEKKVDSKVNKSNKKVAKKRTKRRNIVILFSIVVIFISYIMYRGNYLEMLEIGKNYTGVFYDQIKYRIITIVVSFMWIFGLLYSTNRRIQNGLKDFFAEEKKEMPKILNKSISFISAAIISVITSNIFLQKTILFFNSTSYGKNDLIFRHDIGYYLFVKPFLQSVIIYMLITFIIVTLYAAIYYIIMLNTQFESGVSVETLKKSVIRNQLLSNCIFIIFLIAVLMFLNASDLSSKTFLNVGSGDTAYSLIGAGTADIVIKVWAYRILSILMVIISFIAVDAYKKEKHRRLFASILFVPVYFVVMIFSLMGYDKLFVNSNEYEKEKKYIAYNIENTREAYGIDIETINLEDYGTVTSEEIQLYDDIISNISTTNKNIVLNYLNSTLTSKGLYKYVTSSVGEYTVNEKPTLVYVSPREIVANEKAYTNATYEYTHGYGAIITSASETKSNGDLVNIQKGFENDENVIKINYPKIYFGMETNKTIVTNSKNKNEFDYRSSDSNQSESYASSYDGKAGLNLNILDRFTLALSKGDFNLAFTSNVNGNSKILTNRNVIARAKKVMPYLMYDEAPYMVITSDGRLVWVIDAYTTSKYYPYSQKINVKGQDINYIKNSVKVLVDAYDGDIKFYITDRSDVVVMAYKKAFPDVFMDIDAKIPEEISEHFIYSEFLYGIQSEMIKRYHNTETDVMYRANDIWDVAKYGAGISSSNTEATQMIPYYAMLKTKDSQTTNLGLVLPYTVHGKQGITAYTVGTMNNGSMNMKLYKYPADVTILGPMQLDTQISQNELIAKEIDKLDVPGTKLTKNIVAVPIDSKIIYVESIYQQYINENDSLPKLKKVVVASGNKMAIGDDLKSAIKNLMSQAYNIELEDPENEAELIDMIIKANNNLKESKSSSDFEMIGKDLKRLQVLIEKLEVLRKNNKEVYNSKDQNKVKDQNNLNNIDV